MRHANDRPVRASGEYVLYGIQAARRPSHDHGFDHALREAAGGSASTRSSTRRSPMFSENTAKKFKLGPYLDYFGSLLAGGGMNTHPEGITG